MRFTGILLLATTAAVLLIGCGSDTSSDAAKAKRDEYVREMTKHLDELSVKYEELKSRVAKADDQAKKGLEKTLEDAKVKRDAAAKKLDELKTVGADRWEKAQEGVGNAFQDLKKVFD